MINIFIALLVCFPLKKYFPCKKQKFTMKWIFHPFSMFFHNNLKQFPISNCYQHTVMEIILFVKINLQGPFHHRSEVQISYFTLISGNVVGNNVKFWLQGHQFTHLHFTQCDAVLWPQCNLECKCDFHGVYLFWVIPLG